MTSRPRLVLASASPARLALLLAAGFGPDVIVSGVDETGVPGTPAEVVVELARRKAAAVAEIVAPDQATIVVGCDSLLEFDGAIHGKPASAEAATALWRRLRGRRGKLHTGHCVIALPSGLSATALASTTVHFGRPDDGEIAAYVATGEPMRVAGAFTIDGLGSVFIDRIEGDHGTVVGLSLPVLRRLVAEVGLRLTDLWTPPPSSPEAS